MRWAGPLVAMAAAARYCAGAWGGRPPAGDDVMAHLIRAHYGIDRLFLHGHLDGLLPTFAAGYQEFLFFGQGFTVLLGVIRALTLGTLSDAGALKVAAVASLVAFPPAVAFLGRSLGLSRRAAGVAAILSLAVNNPFGVGFSAVFGSFLVPQQVAAVLACFCIGGTVRIITDPRPCWIVVVAVSAAAITITHVITVFIALTLLAVILPLIWLTDRPDRSAWGRLAVASAAAAGLSAFWLVPFLAHAGLHGPVTTWPTPPLASRLRAILHGTYLFRPGVFVLVLIGACFVLARIAAGRRWAAAPIVAPLGFVVIARLALHRFPTNSIAVQLENRGIGLAAVIATLGLAALLAWATRWAGLAGDIVAVSAAVVVVAVTAGPWAGIAAQQPRPSAGLSGAAAYLRVVAPSTRFAEVRQYPADVNASAGVQHPDFWLAAESGAPTLNEFNVESSDAPGPAFVPERLMQQSAGEDADTLARLGVAHVVSTNPAATAFLLASPRFATAWSLDGWAVLTVSASPGYPLPASMLATSLPAAARLVGADPEHLRIRASATTATPASVAVAWSPRWRVHVNGRRVPSQRTPDGLVAVDLPAGASTVALDWTGDPWQAVGVLITVLTVAGGAVALRMRTSPQLSNRRSQRAPHTLTMTE